MGALDYLFGQQPPSSVTANTATTNGLPDWYQDYIRGIAGKGTQLAGAQANADIPALSVAGFNPDQLQSFDQVRANQGAWQPDIEAAGAAARGIQPNATAMVGRAYDATLGPAQAWSNDAATKYMSPYTQQVIDNIQRLGTRNWEENIRPGIDDAMIGSGQFGSTRNADILSRAGRDVNADITGQIGQALNSGYTNAQTMFTSDQQRQQQQQALQAQTALGGATALTSAGTAGAQQLGALGQTTAGLGLNDATQLGAIGAQEQGLQQSGLDTAYTNANNAMNFDWNTLNNLNSTVRGLQLPSTGATTTNAPLAGASFGAGPLAQVGGALSTLVTKKP